MKNFWTKGRLKEKETILYFLPSQFKDTSITENDWIAFFDKSEQGIEPKEITKGFEAIEWGKSWRGKFCETTDSHRAIYEEGILDGSMPYFVILGGCDKLKWPRWFWKILNRLFKIKDSANSPPPRSVVDFMKKTLFRGIDADIIEKVYQEILKQ